MATKLKKQAAPGSTPEADNLVESQTVNVEQGDYTPTPEEEQENKFNSPREAIFETLLKRPVAFHRIFKTITNNSSSAIFLSQAFYWSNNRSAINRGGWFIKSSREWEDETGLTRNEQETARRICKDLGIIEESLRRWNKHATLHFKLNKSRLYELIDQAASLRKTSKLIDCGKPANYIDCGKPANYTHRLPIDYSQTTQAGKHFKNWRDTPEQYHPFFEACINPPVALPEPTPKKIKAWIKTFDGWIEEGYTAKQVPSAGKLHHDRNLPMPRPGSFTWAFDAVQSKANYRNAVKSIPAVKSRQEYKNGVLVEVPE